MMKMQMMQTVQMLVVVDWYWPMMIVYLSWKTKKTMSYYYYLNSNLMKWTMPTMLSRPRSHLRRRSMLATLKWPCLNRLTIRLNSPIGNRSVAPFESTYRVMALAFSAVRNSWFRFAVAEILSNVPVVVEVIYRLEFCLVHLMDAPVVESILLQVLPFAVASYCDLHTTENSTLKREKKTCVETKSKIMKLFLVWSESVINYKMCAMMLW